MSDGRCPICDSAWVITRTIMSNDVWYDCPKCKKTREQIEKELESKAQEEFDRSESTPKNKVEPGSEKAKKIIAGVPVADDDDGKQLDLFNIDWDTDAWDEFFNL